MPHNLKKINLNRFSITLLNNMSLTATSFLEIAKSISNNDKFEYMNDYIGPNHTLLIRCKIHDIIFEQLPHRHLNNIRACEKCAAEYRGKLKCKTFTVDEFIALSNSKHNSFYGYNIENDDQLRLSTVIDITCPRHGNFKQRVHLHLKGRGCRQCGIIKNSVANRQKSDEFIAKAKLLHDVDYDYSLVEYKNCMTPVTIICKIHGEFKQSPDNHLRGNRGKPNYCPKCKSSSGERKIRDILIKYGITFNEQYRFSNCKHIKPLPFDFFIPSLNSCIEYDGEQHFAPIPRGNESMEAATANFELTKYKDSIKNEFCLKSGINLVRIPYYEYNNIELILNNMLLKHFL